MNREKNIWNGTVRDFPASFSPLFMVGKNDGRMLSRVKTGQVCPDVPDTDIANSCFFDTDSDIFLYSRWIWVVPR
jgi:hypothetical protein